MIKLARGLSWIPIWIALTSTAHAESGAKTVHFLVVPKLLATRSYSSTIDDALNQIGASGHFGFGYDLGIFWNIGPELALGASMTAAIDKYSKTNALAPGSVATLQPAISLLYSPSDTFGKGALFRADLGPAFLLYPASPFTPSGILQPTASSTGLGAQLTAGYGIPLSDTLRLVLSFSYQIAAGSAAQARYTTAGLGFMF